MGFSYQNIVLNFYCRGIDPPIGRLCSLRRIQEEELINCTAGIKGDMSKSINFKERQVCVGFFLFNEFYRQKKSQFLKN